MQCTHHFCNTGINRFKQPVPCLCQCLSLVTGTEFAKLSAEEIRKQREERLKRWREVLLREQNELQREMSVNDDILLVNVVDVYRNLPRKLLKFYSWYELWFVFSSCLAFPNESIDPCLLTEVRSCRFELKQGRQRECYLKMKIRVSVILGFFPIPRLFPSRVACKTCTNYASIKLV